MRRSRWLPSFGAILALVGVGCTERPPRAIAASQPVDDRDATCASPSLDASPPRSLDVDRALGSGISEPKILGATYVPEEFVRVVLTKTPGAKLDPFELEGAEARILGLNAFESVHLRRPPESSTLLVDVRERPRITRLFFVGNATAMAVRSGLSPQLGDVFDRDVLVEMTHAVARAWGLLGETFPRVTVHAKHVKADEIALCVRATALDSAAIDRALDELERLYVERLEVLEWHVYDDADLTLYVNEIGARVASAAGPVPKNFAITITDSADVRGFAEAKDDRVVLSRGLLGVVGSEAQLAAIIAHELGHLSLRHGIAGPLTRALGTEAEAEHTSSWKAYKQMQADRFAIDVTQRLGYDPHEVLSALGTLLLFSFEEEASLPMANDMLARLARVRLLLHGRQGGRVERAAYLAHVDGLPWGETKDGSVLRIRVRGATSEGTLEEVLKRTCPEADLPALSLLNPEHDHPDVLSKDTPLKCLVSERAPR